MNTLLPYPILSWFCPTQSLLLIYINIIIPTCINKRALTNERTGAFTGGSSAAAVANGQPATTTGATTQQQQQQPYRKLESSFDMNALKTGATGAGSKRGLGGGDYGTPDSIVGHLLVVRAECLPRAWAGPAPPPTAPIIAHNTSVASVLTKPSPVDHIQEVGAGGLLIPSCSHVFL